MIKQTVDNYVLQIQEEKDDKLQKDMKVGATLVNSLMDLYNDQDKVCIECFDNNPNFKFLLGKSYEEGINKEGLVS